MHNEFIGIEVNVELLDSQPKVPELEHKQIFQNLFSFFKPYIHIHKCWYKTNNPLTYYDGHTTTHLLFFIMQFLLLPFLDYCVKWESFELVKFMNMHFNQQV
jgi:hypothetical protein